MFKQNVPPEKQVHYIMTNRCSKEQSVARDVCQVFNSHILTQCD